MGSRARQLLRQPAGEDEQFLTIDRVYIDALHGGTSGYFAFEVAEPFADLIGLGWWLSLETPDGRSGRSRRRDAGPA
jgi:hypothetical protein